MPPPEYVFSASQAYFTIFEANAGEIGELPPKVAVQVIAFYHQAKTFLDSMALTDKPNLKNVSAEVLVSHYAMVADFIDRLCTLGDDLVAQLAPADIRNHILRTAQQLDIKEAQQLLRVSWELLKELLTHSQCQLLTYLVSPLLNHSRY
jgi:hypothetical protein